MIICCNKADVRFVVALTAETVILRCVTLGDLHFRLSAPGLISPLSPKLIFHSPRHFTTTSSVYNQHEPKTCSYTSHSDLSSLGLSSQNASTPPLPSCARHPLLPVLALRLFLQPSKQSLRPSLKPIRLLALFLLRSKRMRKIYIKT